MKYYIRPLDKRMILLLKEYQERNMSAIKNLGVKELTQVISGLYTRGLISTRKYYVDDKEEVEIYITDAGINLLNEYEKERRDEWMNNICLN